MIIFKPFINRYIIGMHNDMDDSKLDSYMECGID
jgi:hypothetical protein